MYSHPCKTSYTRNSICNDGRHYDTPFQSVNDVFLTLNEVLCTAVCELVVIHVLHVPRHVGALEHIRTGLHICPPCFVLVHRCRNRQGRVCLVKVIKGVAVVDSRLFFGFLIPVCARVWNSGTVEIGQVQGNN